MKANMGPAAASGDGPDLAKGLDYIAAHAPAGMPNWSGIAKGGAAKAKAGDIDGAKAACKSCHDQYKAKYKAEVRDRPF
jgi:cytochrome c553